MKSFLEDMRFVSALQPVANAFAGTVYPNGINLSAHGRLCFVVQKGVGTTGTTTIQVVAGDDKSPTNESAVPFSYRRLTAASGDTGQAPGAITAATSAGFLTTAGSADTYIIEIDAKALAASGYKYAHLKMVESVASAVVGSVLAIAGWPRFADNTSDLIG